MTTLYTAVGVLKIKNDERGRYPQITVKGKEHNVDMGEMLIWSALNWRILPLRQVKELFRNGLAQSGAKLDRPFAEYVERLITRGLIVSGSGDTDADALYDLLCDLYVIPTESSLLTKLSSFLKVVFADGVPLKSAKWIFKRGKLSGDERRVMDIVKQAFLSTAEITKCVEVGCFDVSTDDKVMLAVYDDDFTTCDNIRYYADAFQAKRPVLTAVANLYLRKQIIFTRV